MCSIKMEDYQSKIGTGGHSDDSSEIGFTDYLKNGLRFATKCATYPLFGNADTRTRELLEEKLGEQNFSSDDASSISMFTNLTAYTITAAYGMDYLTHDFKGFVLGAVLGAVAGIIEGGLRYTPKAGGDDLVGSSLLGNVFRPIGWVCEE